MKVSQTCANLDELDCGTQETSTQQMPNNGMFLIERMTTSAQHVLSSIYSFIRSYACFPCNKLCDAFFTETVLTGKKLKRDGGGVTSILTTKTANALAEQLATSGKKERVFDAFLDHLDSGILDSLITKQKFDYYALRALLKGKITQLQFGTLLGFKAAIVEALKDGIVFKDIQLINLYNSGTNFSEKAIKYLNLKTELTDEALAKFQNAFASCSNREKYFLLIPKGESEKKSDLLYQKLMRENAPFSEYSKVSISSLAREIKYTFLTETREDTFEYQIATSLTLIQEYLYAKYGQNAFQVQPVIGIPSEKTMLKFVLQGIRPISIPFTGLTTPSVAHGFQTSPHKYMLHDVFHIRDASQVPAKIRSALLDIAKFLSTIHPSNKIERKLCFHLTDLNIDPTGVDWTKVDLAEAFRKVFINTFNDLDREEDDGLDFYFELMNYKEASDVKWSKYIEYSGIAEKIANHIHINRDSWFHEYGVDGSNYTELTQHIKELTKITKLQI